ncbi:MAG: AAA family ATPase [Erysipelotrichaceae bacterium]
MMKYVSVKDMARKWNISERRVIELCKSGRISDARKEGTWLIPSDAQKPFDKRIKSKKTNNSADKKISKKLPLPIGVTDYKKACTKYYYVDKTLLIRDFLDECPMVSLFTRPRRFGKTLNMDMLKVFFELSAEDNSVYFRDKKIWECGEEYTSHQGKYPVILISFKEVKTDSWEAAYDLIYKLVCAEINRHKELLDSDSLSEFDKQYLLTMLNGKGNENDAALSLMNLSRMLHMHYGVAPIIIIDEYDIPIERGYVCGYYDEIINFMRILFSGGLKDNPHLSYGFMTGILRVAKESIFSGLNNIKVNSILDERYSEYFGFTAQEVKGMADYYDVPHKYEEICSWYDGYCFGDKDIFNPWSVVSYFNNGCIPQAFWQSTASNDIIGEIIAESSDAVSENLERLMRGESIVTHIDTSVIYPRIKDNPSSIYSFLLVSGYLKAVKVNVDFTGDYMCTVSLPNKEISCVFAKEILSRFENVIGQSTAIEIREAIYLNDINRLKKAVESYFVNTVSYLDSANESFYHGIVLGLCAILDNIYLVRSNRESGYGRYDIQLMPIDKKHPGLIIELKSGKNNKSLDKLAEEAIEQIKNQKYAADMLKNGVKDIILYGMAFSGKDIIIKMEKM